MMRVGFVVFPVLPLTRTPVPFGSAAVPVMFTPIQFPFTALPPQHSLHSTPVPFPEIRLRAPAAELPTEPIDRCDMKTPLGLGSAERPPAAAPMMFPWIAAS